MRRHGGISRFARTVRLIDARGGFQRWSERYDRQLADIFEIQDEMAHRLLNYTVPIADLRQLRH